MDERPGSVGLTRRRFLQAGIVGSAGLALGAVAPGLGLPAGASVAGADDLLDAAVTPGTPWITRHGLDAASYQAAFDEYLRAGYRLVRVAGYDTAAGARYAGIWERSASGPWVARHGLDATAYQNTFNSLTGQGYRLRALSGYTDNGAVRYAAVWERVGGPAWQARHGLTAAEYQSVFNQLAGQGYRPRSVSGYTDRGVVRYAAFWEQASGPAWVARHGLTAAEHQAHFDTFVARGYRPVHVNGYATPAGPRFASIFEQAAGPAFDTRHGLAGVTYQESVNVWALWGLRPLAVSGYRDGNDVRYATIWIGDGRSASSLVGFQGVIESFLRNRSILASQFALATGGRLVYARAFGAADPTSPAPVTLRHRFRVASVSKPITAAAVFALVDAGRLTLDQRVFGTGAILGTTYGTKPYGENLQAITVRHLLEHSVGTWANDGNDPMFLDNALTQAQLITQTIDDRPPTAAPGNTFAYSNFGYCVLGRVIEAASGQSYAAYVASVLARAGVTRAAIGGNTLADRLPEEVVYQGRNGEDPYGMNVTRMDAHGGWIATAPDVVRFALAVDGRTPPADILTAGSQQAMDTPSAANASYARGWSVNGANRWHNGSLPGTSAILVRTGDGFTWAGLLNTRDGTMVGDLDAVIWEAWRKVTRWPDGALAWP